MKRSTVNGQGAGWTPAPDAEAHQSHLAAAQMRATLYRFLGTLFLYPDAERLATLHSAAQELAHAADLWAELPYGAAWLPLLAALSDLPPGANVPVEEEFVRLFLARPAAAPLESLYLDEAGLARGLIVAQVAGEYRRAGLAMAEVMIEQPDHVAVELEFMAFLSQREATALAADDTEQVTLAGEAQREFFKRHLQRWFPTFARRVRDARPEHFYGTVIQAAFAFLGHERVLLRLVEKPP